MVGETKGVQQETYISRPLKEIGSARFMNRVWLTLREDCQFSVKEADRFCRNVIKALSNAPAAVKRGPSVNLYRLQKRAIKLITAGNFDPRLARASRSIFLGSYE